MTSFPGPTPHPSSLVNIFKNPQKKQGTTTSSVGLQAFPPLFVFSTFTPVSDRCEPHHETCQRDRRATDHHPDASPSFWLPGNAPRERCLALCLVTIGLQATWGLTELSYVGYLQIIHVKRIFHDEPCIFGGSPHLK